MKQRNRFLTPQTRNRLMVQGYCSYTDGELRAHRFGIRFAYVLCGTLVLLGLLLNYLPLLMAAAAIALLGVFPPRHPFDYLYNHLVRHLLRKPRLPPRTAQGRFACGIAAIWLSATVYLFLHHHAVAGYLFGAVLLCSAALVSTTDVCIPSMIYNRIWKRKRNSLKKG